MMESPLEKKRLQRAPSPARPAVLRDVFRDVHPRPAKPPVPKSPRIRGKTARQTPLLLSRRKEKPVPDRSVPRSTSTPTRKPNAVDTSPSNVFLTRNKRGQTRLYRTDSSSELSDCPSDPLSGGSPESACSLRGSTRRTDDLQREVEELRAENHYLKDEVEELRVEIEEMRDSYLEEEVYQLQELRRELDRANKNSRILQYRLRKAEQKSLRVAQSGQVDGDLLRSLEQDLKVAKDVSVRLHNELECVENKRCRAEDENELLRQKIIEVEISKQALYNELERAKESSARRRGTRDVCRKSASQEDSADLRCQLQFCKEESALMRKKLAKTSREKDELEQELQEYKRVYGDADGSLSLSEPELKLRLKLVEEEATILGRKVVELEVETHGLRAENEDLRSQFERDPLSSVPSSPYGDSPAEMRRHLQFVEEEAELLRRSIAEIEDHNKQLTSELNRFKFGPASEEGVEPLEGVVSSGSTSLREELKAAGMQISELSSKVLKLQYENRVLMSNVQRCDLASHLGTRGNLHTHGESQEDMQTHGGSQGTTRPVRQGPVGGENEAEDTYEKTSGFSSEGGRGLREGAELLNGLRREAEVLSHAVDRLIAETEIGGDTANRSMKAFRTELHIFMEKVEHLDEQHEDSTPHLTESSSFLSSVTNMSRDSPVTTHRDISDTQLRDVAVRPDDEEECEVWTQERSLLQQELRLLRHNMAAVYVKLRWLLVSWRMGLRTRSGEESSVTECEALDTIPELRLLLDHTDSPGSGPSTHTPELGQHHKQAGENRRVLHALRTLLEEFRSELRDEEQRRCHLQQSYANERAGWEVQWAELKCHTRQSDEACEDSVMTREREEHRRVLAESHSTCMELRWRLQHGERRWNRERAELLERFHRDRQEWEWTTRELQHKLDNLQVEQSTSSPEGKGSPHRICSPQGSPHSPRTLLSSQTLPTSRSQSDPEPPLEDRPTSVRQKTSENLFLDALSLDPLAASQGTQRLSLKENLNEIQDRSLSAVHQADLSTGSLLRAKSICSMSEFQRLMDSSPFLPEKRTPSNGGGDEATPPLSPDDLKYIEEFNSKDWDIPPVDISMSPSGRPTDVWIEESELRTLSSPWLPSTSTCSRSSGLRWLPTNMSDDMKEVALSVRPAARPVLRDSACQTNRSTQTSPCLSVALQTDLPRCLTPKGGSTPVSSPSRRKVQYSPAVQAKFERQCCSPKYGSPKLPRRPPATKAEAPATRAATPATPQKGFSESAWARSTTTRDSPVHTTINDGLSSLFNIIDHSPVLHDALHRLTRSPSRCRSPSPIQLIVETQGEKNGETLSIRQDLSAPPGHTLAENAARILNRRLMEQMCSEERRLSASEGKNDTQAHVEDLPHSPAAPFLQSCFQRPARPANRRLPSRWATRSPSCSPNWSQNAGPSFSLSPPDSALEHNFV